MKSAYLLFLESLDRSESPDSVSGPEYPLAMLWWDPDDELEVVDVHEV